MSRVEELLELCVMDSMQKSASFFSKAVQTANTLHGSGGGSPSHVQAAIVNQKIMNSMAASRKIHTDRLHELAPLATRAPRFTRGSSLNGAEAAAGIWG